MSSGQRSGARYRRHFLVDNCAFHVERCMTVMQSGTQMVKLKRGTKGLVRLFYLDEHRSRLRWRPSRKGERAKILIDTIYKVTEGRQSEIFLRQPEGALDPSCCFTIYHGLHMEPLDLLTANPEEARTWVTGLKYLLAGIRDEDSLAKRQRTHDQWVKQTFEEADKNGDGLLSIDEIHQLMHKLNVSLPRRKVRQMFQEADTDENRGTLAFEEFCVFYSMMSLRRDLYLLLLSHSGKKDHLTPDELARFLRAEQKMNNVTTEDCLDIIRTFEVSEENRANGVLGIEGFTHFLRSPACDVFNPQHRTVHQDMEQPLSSYYIAASHNTYLTGDQLLSQSRADMYARVLQDGCRCVEVDCWDGPDGEPVVHHGYTLTSKILFRDVVETINRAAFEKNDFPVILSLENHCSVPQQRKLARYLKEILRDKLDLSAVHMGDAGQLPSPQSLRGKILLKSKKLPPHLGADAEEGEVSDEDSADELEEECRFPQRQSAGGSELQAESTTRRKLELLLRERARAREDTDGCTVRALLRATREGLDAHLGQQRQRSRTKGSRKTPHVVGLGRQKTGKSLSRACSSDEEEVTENPGREGGQLPRPVRRRKTMKLCRELSDLVVYTNSVAARDLVDDGSSGNVLSFSEARARQLLQHKWEQLMALNQRQLTRVYPSACRVDSSNFNPLPYWSAGCQLVALNYQSEGRMMQLNRAKFQANGNCGYVLKPQQMCRGTFNPFSGDPFPANPKKQLVLKVISGQQLPKPPDSMFGDRGEIIDPFVEVEILGLPVDCCKDQTRVVDDNGFNPVWEETLTFTVHMPDLALVRFLVWDHDPIGRDFVGQRTVPFSSLAPGYRHVYLEGLPEASLFVHVTINEIYGKWSPLILNPSYTILHVLGATKSRQLQGLKGLFSRNPRPGIAEGTPHAVRKRSLGERILRRSASAPTKGRKKSKLVLQGEVDARDELPEAPREPASVLRRAPRSLQARPVSMPVDRSVLEPLALPLPARAGDPGGQEETQAERQDHGRSAGPATVGHPGLSSSLSSSSSSAPEHPDPPDSDVSRLIDQAALSLDSEPGSSISALLGDPLDEPGVPAESASQPCPSPAPAAPDWAALCFCSADSSLVEVGVDPGTVSFGAWDAVRQDPGSRGSPSGRAPAAPPSHQPPPAPALPSPCKSKSLGDLTSEDIACTFEGKYRCISRSFVAAGPPPRPGADALTEQLRRLVSGEPEDARPEALTRKLSSRSQSRVRNIASRARERDGARARTGGAQDAVGAAVVLRSKPRAGQPLGMRHSTGSYIAGYLGARGAEGRGVPEGCAAPRPGRLHPLCVQGRALQAEPGGANKPEIYFLLRL
ncbi:1-phosphatidylinositol 4,5-bisphosphate phosphodiesterase eta-1 [Sorex fumeus]|uniref:1-phosphatidylinositol 4,5-bisphosphate phosphodiesterase eta-1 n=1 Tax=Sorex fumeus TaxID=62283 RepID=UPI0024ADAAEA|nr:1-phosphatidylinositol 4,5-bisphosphate phosphodiesterase eta-1 [Sorex fumeus]